MKPRFSLFILAPVFSLLAPLIQAATPLVDAKLSGANNQVVSGSTFTIKSGANFVIEGGGTFSGAQAHDLTLDAWAGLPTAANKLGYFTGSDTAALLDFSAFAQSLMPLTTSAAWRAALFPPSPTAGDIMYYNGSSWVYQHLGSLSTGLVKVTTGTGALGNATAGTDYIGPGSIVGSGLILPSGLLAGRATAGTGAIEGIMIGAGLALDPATQTLSAAGGNLLPDQTGNSGKFLTTDGTTTSWASPNTNSLNTITWSSSVALSFASPMQTVPLTGATTFTTSSLAAGAQISVRIVCDSTARTLSFPSGWVWVGGSAPSSIAASKTALLSLISFTTADTGVIAAYAVQP